MRGLQHLARWRHAHSRQGCVRSVGMQICQHTEPFSDLSTRLAAAKCPCVCLQEAVESFAAAISEGSTDSMYMALRQAISGHSPAIIPPASKPLVLAGPFGAACCKGELLQWLFKEYGDKLALPEMCTTKPRAEGATADSPFKVRPVLCQMNLYPCTTSCDRTCTGNMQSAEQLACAQLYWHENLSTTSLVVCVCAA